MRRTRFALVGVLDAERSCRAEEAEFVKGTRDLVVDRIDLLDRTLGAVEPGGRAAPGVPELAAV